MNFKLTDFFHEIFMILSEFRDYIIQIKNDSIRNSILVGG